MRLAIYLMVTAGLSCVASRDASAQTPTQVEDAVQAARRAGKEYDRRAKQDEQDSLDLLARNNLSEINIEQQICRPMHLQKTQSRRAYIESRVSKKSQRRMVMNLCYEQELAMYGLCSPLNEGSDVKPSSSTCIGKREDWPKPPVMKDYMTPFNLAGYDRAVASYNAMIAAKYQ